MLVQQSQAVEKILLDLRCAFSDQAIQIRLRCRRSLWRLLGQRG